MKGKKLLLTALIFAVLLTVLCACGAKAQSISIKTLPQKTTYEIGEALKLEGGEIEVLYDNGDKKTVKMTNSSVSVKSFDNTKAGTATVTIQYSKLQTEFTVTINEKTDEVVLSKVEIEKLPKKLVYLTNNTLDLVEGTLKLTYSDESTEIIPMTDASATYDFKTAGEKEVKLTYKGFTVKFNVTVNKPAVTSIEIMTEPTIMEYYYGSEIDVSDGVVRIHYENGTHSDLPMTSSEFEIEYDFSEPNDFAVVTVKYVGFSDTFTVRVIVKPVSWSMVDNMIDWAVYFYQDWRDAPFIHAYFMLMEMENNVYMTKDQSIIDYYEAEYAPYVGEVSLIFNELIYFDGLLDEESLPFLKTLCELAFARDTHDPNMGNYVPTTDEAMKLMDLYENLSDFDRTKILFGIISDPVYYGEMYTAYWYYINITAAYFSTFMSTSEVNCYYTLIQSDIMYSAYEEYTEQSDLYRFYRYFTYVIEYYENIEDKTLWDSWFGELYEYYYAIYLEVDGIPREILDIIQLIENEINDALYYLVNFNEFSYYLTYLSDLFDMINAAKADPNLSTWITDISFFSFEGYSITLDEVYYIYLDDFESILYDEFHDYYDGIGLGEFYLREIHPVVRKWIHSQGGIYIFNPLTIDRNAYPEFDSDVEAMWHAIFEELGDYKYALSMLIYQLNYYSMSAMTRDHYSYVLSAEEYALYTALFSAASSYFAYFTHGIPAYFDTFLERMGAIVVQYENLTDSAMFDSLESKTTYDYWVSFYRLYVLPDPEGYDSSYLTGLFEKLNFWSSSRDTIWLSYYFEILKEIEYIYSQGNEELEYFFEFTFGWRMEDATAHMNTNFYNIVQTLNNDESGEFYEFVSIATTILRNWTENNPGWPNFDPRYNDDAAKMLKLFTTLSPEMVGAFVVDIKPSDFHYFYSVYTGYYKQLTSSSDSWWDMAQAYANYCAWVLTGAVDYYNVFIASAERSIAAYDKISNKTLFDSVTENIYAKVLGLYNIFSVAPPTGYEWTTISNYFSAMRYYIDEDITYVYFYLMLMDEIDYIMSSERQDWKDYFNLCYGTALADAKNFFKTNYYDNAPDLFGDDEAVVFVKYFLTQYLTGDFNNYYNVIIDELNRLYGELNGKHKDQLLSEVIEHFVYWYCMVQTTYYLSFCGFSVDEVNVYWVLIHADLNYYAWLETSNPVRYDGFAEAMELAISRYASLINKTRFNNYFKDLYDSWVEIYLGIEPNVAIIAIIKRFYL